MEKIRNKISLNKIIRRVIQIVAFVLMPSLFISAFSAIKDVYTALIKGSFSVSALSYQLLILIAVIPITALMGRFFCGFLCSFGSMGDLVWFIGRKVNKNPVKISEKADGILKLLKYGILLFIVILMWTFGVAINSSMDPWTIFGMYFSISGWSSTAYLLSIGSGLLLLIIVGSFFAERFFCRYICPLGAVFALTSNFRLFRIKKPSEKCKECRICTRHCSMGIPLYKYEEVKSGECINCFECIEACPRKNISVNPTPSVAAAVTVAAITGLYYAGNLANQNVLAESSTPTTITNSSQSKGQYTDGTYTGKATGYKGETQVQVTVSNGNINNIEVLSTGDDNEFFNRAKSTIINDIISTQSTNVVAVSGATFSSNGIINAVKNALSSVTTTSVSGSTQSAITTTAQAQNQTSTSVSPSSASSITVLKDGIYSGTGTGFRGKTSVSVTVTNSKIAKIDVTSYSDDEQYFSRAKSTIISNIISKQTVQVDTVSGATFSSNGIKEAVANALGIEFTNPNSTISGQNHGDRPSPGGR